MKFGDPYWSEREKMDLLSRWIIVHSVIYYELDSSVIKDAQFDFNSKLLVSMAKSNTSQFKATRWYYVMKDFDGSTGFDLYGKLNFKDKKIILQTANYVDWSVKLGRWES